MNGMAAFTPPAATLRVPCGWQMHRSRRVLLLLAGIIALSMADLVITLTHLRSTGMAEANPLARLIIGATGSPLSLACFKTLSVLTCVLLLYKVRQTWQGEIAAWCAMLILAGMSVMWFQYANQYESPLDLQLAQTSGDEHLWVRFE